MISAGIHEAVESFVKRLGVPSSQVFGVEVYFDEKGDYRDYDRQSPMTSQHGKRKIVEALLSSHPRLIHVGDGMNDVEAASLVERFIGYGGAYYRDHIASLCDFYIKARSLSAVLPLCLTKIESERLSSDHRSIYQKGLKQINDGQVLIK